MNQRAAATLIILLAPFDAGAVDGDPGPEAIGQAKISVMIPERITVKELEGSGYESYAGVGSSFGHRRFVIKSNSGRARERYRLTTRDGGGGRRFRLAQPSFSEISTGVGKDARVEVVTRRSARSLIVAPE